MTESTSRQFGRQREYRGEDRPFSRDAVGRILRRLALPAFGVLGLAAGLIWGVTHLVARPDDLIPAVITVIGGVIVGAFTDLLTTVHGDAQADSDRHRRMAARCFVVASAMWLVTGALALTGQGGVAPLVTGTIATFLTTASATLRVTSALEGPSLSS